LRKMSDKFPVEIPKSQEGSDCLYICRGWPILYTCQLCVVHGNFVGSDDQTQGFHFVDVELAFLWLQVQVIFCQSLQYPLCPFLVFVLVLGEYQDVIHVNYEPSFSDHVTEYLVHHCLEEHHRWFKQPLIRLEGCLPLISVLDSDVVIPPLNVQFCKPFRPSQFVQQVPYQRQWVGVLDRSIVQVPVILAGP
ncbi:hypothetical protein L208DRAFT_1234020, partial [Tricholoma matsutake]